MGEILAGKTIILGISGGIAAYKSAELVRLLVKAGASVTAIMTRAATRFVGPLTLEALSGNPVLIDLFDDAYDASMAHIELAQMADAIVIAPATANIIAKIAAGIADDALSTFMLAATVPSVICPSMNTHMLEKDVVQRNLKTLQSDGHLVLTPGAGQLACGTTGAGRLPEPHEILDRLISHLSPKDFAGICVLVSAGPTQEAIDPVRFVSNPSSGKMGYAIARAAERRGGRVTLISGPTHLTDPLNMETIRVLSARQMAREVLARLPRQDLIVKAAAVSDYRPKERADYKIKKDSREIEISMQSNPDILKTIGQQKGERVLVGFAAETGDLAKHAGQKLVAKNLDMIVGNLIGPIDSGFKSDTNRVTLFFADGRREPLAVMPKETIADIILDRAIALLKKRKRKST
jgi:phosphopantothenoylcysteine decarboxylase/phosphopantothenate--cysteine ligase